MDEKVPATEVWAAFKRIGPILDIIFPKSKDHFGNRYGFILMKNHDGACKVSKDGAKLKFNGKKIHLDWTRERGWKIFEETKHVDGRHKGDIQDIKIPKARLDNQKAKLMDLLAEEVITQSQTEEESSNFQIEMESDWMEEIKRSTTIETLQDYSSDSFAEIILTQGFTNIKVSKAEVCRFILTFFEDGEKKDMDWKTGSQWIKSKRDTVSQYLIVPRKVWIKLFGLPSLNFRDEVFEKIISKWGNLVSKNIKTINNRCLVIQKLCISTKQVEEIKGTLMVKIRGELFHIKFQEDPHILGEIAREEDYKQYHKDSESIFSTEKEQWSKGSLDEREIQNISCNDIPQVNNEVWGSMLDNPCSADTDDKEGESSNSMTSIDDPLFEEEDYREAILAN